MEHYGMLSQTLSLVTANAGCVIAQGRRGEVLKSQTMCLEKRRRRGQ
jgi:hypothetical protein